MAGVRVLLTPMDGSAAETLSLAAVGLLGLGSSSLPENPRRIQKALSLTARGLSSIGVAQNCVVSVEIHPTPTDDGLLGPDLSETSSSDDDDGDEADLLLKVASLEKTLSGLTVEEDSSVAQCGGPSGPPDTTAMEEPLTDTVEEPDFRPKYTSTPLKELKVHRKAVKIPAPLDLEESGAYDPSPPPKRQALASGPKLHLLEVKKLKVREELAKPGAKTPKSTSMTKFRKLQTAAQKRFGRRNDPVEASSGLSTSSSRSSSVSGHKGPRPAGKKQDARRTLTKGRKKKLPALSAKSGYRYVQLGEGRWAVYSSQTVVLGHGDGPRLLVFPHSDLFLEPLQSHLLKNTLYMSMRAVKALNDML